MECAELEDGEAPRWPGTWSGGSDLRRRLPMPGRGFCGRGQGACWWRLCVSMAALLRPAAYPFYRGERESQRWRQKGEDFGGQGCPVPVALGLLRALLGAYVVIAALPQGVGFKESPR